MSRAQLFLLVIFSLICFIFTQDQVAAYNAPEEQPYSTEEALEPNIFAHPWGGEAGALFTGNPRVGVPSPSNQRLTYGIVQGVGSYLFCINHCVGIAVQAGYRWTTFDW